jgi:hypothetical protein
VRGFARRAPSSPLTFSGDLRSCLDGTSYDAPDGGRCVPGLMVPYAKSATQRHRLDTGTLPARYSLSNGERGRGRLPGGGHGRRNLFT